MHFLNENHFAAILCSVIRKSQLFHKIWIALADVARAKIMNRD